MNNGDKQALLNGSATIETKIEILPLIQGEEPIILDQNNSVIKWNYEDFRYVKNEGWIGQFVARQVTGDLKNINDSFSITDREFKLWLGVRINNETTWYSLGNFLVTKIKDDEVKDKTTFESLDYTKKFNKTYVDRMTYPCTAGDLAQDVCDQCEVELGSITFNNSDYIIEGNPFTNNESCRDVMKAIGKLAFSWVRVDWDNKVYIDFEKETITETYNTINNSKYYNLKTQKETFGPVNRIIIGYSQIDGEKTKIEDAASIEANGLCELTIYDNPLVYTQSQRESVINAGSGLLGLTYTPLETLTVGHPWLKGKELISVTDMEDISHTTIPFDRTIQYFGHIKTLINSYASTKTNETFAYEPTMKKDLNRTELMVEKDSQRITGIISQIGDRGSKQTTITEDIDGLASQVQDIPTITTEASGTGSLTLTNLANTKLISLRIHPTDRDIVGLLVSHSWKVNTGIKVLSRGITFHNLDGTDLYYKLPTNLYYYDNETYDEFFYDGLEEKIYVVRKVEVDELGNKSLLDTPITEEYEYKPIVLDEGNYNVYLSTYNTAYVNVKAMIKNDYTSSFATSYEVDTKISQTNKQIELVAEEKTDKNEVIADLNLAIENHKGVVRLKGNTVEIQSDNFELDEEGNVNMRGGNLYLTGGSQILGDDGLMSTMIISSVICSSQFVGGSTLLPMGFSGVAQDQYGNIFVSKDWLSFEFDIPNDFIIKSAKIILTHVPVNYTGYDTATGVSRKLNLYKSNNGINQSITLDDMYHYFINDNTGYTKVDNAFGTNGFTGHSTYGEQATSIDLKNYITAGFNKFKIQSDETTPTTFHQCYEYSGACMATLQITGYTKFEENTTRTLLGGIVEEENNEEGSEEDEL